MVQQLKSFDSWEVMAVEVFNERWEAEYNGGKELAGLHCSMQTHCCTLAALSCVMCSGKHLLYIGCPAFP